MWTASDQDVCCHLGLPAIQFVIDSTLDSHSDCRNRGGWWPKIHSSGVRYLLIQWLGYYSLDTGLPSWCSWWQVCISTSDMHEKPLMRICRHHSGGHQVKPGINHRNWKQVLTCGNILTSVRQHHITGTCLVNIGVELAFFFFFYED